MSTAERKLFFYLIFSAVGYSFSLFFPEAEVLAKKKARFLHTPPKTVRAGRSVKIEGKIVYGDELDYAEFRYRPLGSKGEFKAIKMSQKGDKFFAVIPKSDVKPPGIEYYVVGIDFNGKAMILAGSVAVPLQFFVEEGVEGEEEEGETPGKGGEKNQIEREKRKEKAPVRTGLLTGGATIEERPASEVPLGVTVITGRDIENYGWLTIKEILRVSGGLDVNDRGATADIGVRGVNPHYGFGGGVKFLLDGYDLVWRQLQANWVNPSMAFPQDIERIEIYKFPVAGIAGRGSLYGAVMIFSKRPGREWSYQVDAGLSATSGSSFAFGRAARLFENGFSVSGSISAFQNNRTPTLAPIYEFANYPPDNPSGIAYRSPDDRQFSQNLYLRLGWKGFRFSLYQSHYNATVPISRYTPIGGDDGHYITDRLIAKLGWSGALGKWGRLLAELSYDLYRLNSGSRISFNPFSPGSSREEDGGNSRSYLVEREEKDPTTGKTKKIVQILPSCEVLSPGVPDGVNCVRIETVEYSENKKKKREKACLVMTKGTKFKGGIQKVDPAERGSSWFPLSSCRPIYSDGRHLRRVAAEDNRVGLNLQLDLFPLKWLQLRGGLSFEFLQSTLWHFPEFWQREVELPLDSEQTQPSLSNIRFSTFIQADGYPLPWLGFTAAVRLDFDQRVGLKFYPLVGVGFFTGFGLFAKLHYSAGSQPPGLYQLYFVEGNRYGNPLLYDEDGHSIGLQIGWERSKLLSVSLSGFFSLYSSPIVEGEFDSKKEGLQGAENFEFPVKNLPQKFTQLYNSPYGRTVFGGELEARLFPIAGFEMRGFFGLSLANEPIDDNGTIARVPYSSALYAGGNASYRYKMFRISLGFFYTGSKVVPLTTFKMRGVLPAKALEGGEEGVAVPNWGLNNHPLAPGEEDIPRANSQFRLNLTLQLLKLFGHLDFIIRAQNILGLAIPSYDAGTPLLYPQKGFDLFFWLRVHQ